MYECPAHKVKYTRPGKCAVALATKYCVLCGEVNPRESHKTHNKPGCGGRVVSGSVACGLQLIQVMR